MRCLSIVAASLLLLMSASSGHFAQGSISIRQRYQSKLTLTDVARLSAYATKGSIIIFKNQHPESKVLNGISATISEVEASRLGSNPDVQAIVPDLLHSPRTEGVAVAVVAGHRRPRIVAWNRLAALKRRGSLSVRSKWRGGGDPFPIGRGGGRRFVPARCRW